MKKGKICVSVCAETAEETLRQIRGAEAFADVIEVRVDCVRSDDPVKLATEIYSDKPILITFRPSSQGGQGPSELSIRQEFWNTLAAGNFAAKEIWFDHEYDLTGIPRAQNTLSIRSFHDFRGVPENLDEIFSRLSANDEIAKIAVQTDDITDAIPVWKLLAKAKAENKPLIPIAMGDGGKWTRILGPAFGSFMTFAALESGSETAPGQITASDMIDVFRVKELNENVDIYGIIAGDTSYSSSPFMHNAAFKAEKMNAVFLPLQVRDLGDFIGRMVKPETREIELAFRGFSVTNPHKQAIIEYLDFIDETAEKIGAVNTVRVEKGKLYGYNTDAYGFMAPLKVLFGDLSGANVAVAGAGGAARACIYALQQEGANVALLVRNVRKAQSLADEFNVRIEPLTLGQSPMATSFDILVNATPLGTKGALQNQTIALSDQLGATKLVYDLIYNPSETRLIHEARSADIETLGGMEMLIAQGVKQFEIWTGKNAPGDSMAAAVRKRLQL